MMPEVPTDPFVEAVKAVVKANHEYVPPYESGGSLYLRPLLIALVTSLVYNPPKNISLRSLPCLLAITLKVA